MSMWEPFSDSARHAIVVAQEEANKLGHDYLGSEHVLLGIIQDERSGASKALRAAGVDEGLIVAQIEKIKGHGSGSKKQEMAFSPMARRVVEQAFEEARRLNQRFIGTDHLFLGMLAVNDSVATSIIRESVNDVSALRNQVLAALKRERQTIHSRAATRVKGYEIRLVVVDVDQLENAGSAIEAYGREGFSVVAATALTPKSVLVILQREA